MRKILESDEIPSISEILDCFRELDRPSSQTLFQSINVGFRAKLCAAIENPGFTSVQKIIIAYQFLEESSDDKKMIIAFQKAGLLTSKGEMPAAIADALKIESAQSSGVALTV